jgi:hypothetical protein
MAVSWRFMTFHRSTECIYVQVIRVVVFNDSSEAHEIEREWIEANEPCHDVQAGREWVQDLETPERL